MNFFITGILIGIVSLIPGISGGTIIMLSPKYQEILQSISHLNFKIILRLLLGVILGTIFSAKFIEYLFKTIPTETLFFFIGLLLFSFPKLIKKEASYFSFPYLLIGMSLIYITFLLTPTHSLIITQFSPLTLTFLLIFMLCGLLDGFFTILPGISGSLIMMILGPYYLYKSYLANLNLLTIIPLLFYFLGDLLGVFLGSKLSLILLKKYHTITISILTGMLLMSIVLLIPKTSYPLSLIITSTIAFLLSSIPILIINKLTK